MNKLFFSAALTAALISAQAAAQPAAAGGGMQQQNMTRQQAHQFSNSTFQRLDLNHDGTVTREEADQAVAGGHGHMIQRMFASAQTLTLAQFEAVSLAQFDAVDLNHDGVITAAERDQARAARHAQQRQGQ